MLKILYCDAVIILFKQGRKKPDVNSQEPKKQHTAKAAPKPTRAEVLFQRHQERVKSRKAAKETLEGQNTVAKMLSFKERMKMKRKRPPQHSQASGRDQEKKPEEVPKSDTR